MSSQLSIGIVGGGIGGLTVASALIRHGFRVRVYEQASHYIPTAGAGFGLSPNGQVCLASIGIDTRPLLHKFDRIVLLDRYGAVKAESDLLLRIREKYGFGLSGCLRADLVDKLSQSLTEIDGDCLKYSHKVVSIDQNETSVRLQFDGKDDAHHDVVIGADGIHSKVAKLINIDDSPPIYSGANIFYGVIEDPDQVKFEHQLAAQDGDVIQGNCKGEFITFRAGPDEKKVQIWATTYPSTSPPPREEWGVADSSSPELRSVLDDFPPSHPAHELTSLTTPGRLLHFGLFFRKHKDIWAKGRTCLLGDSCHATLPYVGQGANLAIEDAVVLAECLSEYETVDEAFKVYFEKRFRRTSRVVRMANIMDTLHHTQNPLLILMRDFLLTRFVKGRMIAKAVEGEIIEECPIPVKDFAKYSGIIM